jgi:hypothetical protein
MHNKKAPKSNMGTQQGSDEEYLKVKKVLRPKRIVKKINEHQ